MNIEKLRLKALEEIALRCFQELCAPWDKETCKQQLEKEIQERIETFKRSTAERLHYHMENEDNIASRTPFKLRGFDFAVVRRSFVTKNGVKLSIQQGASHYCNKKQNQYELGFVPFSKLLEPYGSEEDPIFGYVPEEVVIAYIDEIESINPHPKAEKI